MRLTNKAALVTGASRGIGRAIALQLARDGALVAVNYARNADAAAEVVKAIGMAGGAAFSVQADMGIMADIERLYETLDEELTRRTGATHFDILVNNAATSIPLTIDQATEETFDRTFAVDIKGPFFVTQKALLRLNDGGRIVNISSATVNGAMIESVQYTMAKAALHMLSVNVAVQYGPRGITANTVAPGLTETDATQRFSAEFKVGAAQRTPLRRVGLPADIADVVAFLASDEARWVTGQFIEASGGLHI